MGELFQLMGTLVVITARAGPHSARPRWCAAFVPFRWAAYALAPPAALGIVAAAGGIFLAALELAAPVLAATMLVEVAVSLLGKLSPAAAGDVADRAAQDLDRLCRS